LLSGGAVKAQFIQLRALQELDTDLKTLTDRATEVPKRIEKLRSDLERAKARLETAQAGITDHKKQLKLAEVELKAAEDKITTYSVQLYSAKTNEQYKAFLKEIETQKKGKSAVEDRMIVLMEESEVLERERVAAEKEHAELAQDTEGKVKSLEAELVEIKAAVTEREANRKELAAAMPATLLKHYERIRRNKAGLAVVTSKGDRCGGCLNPVPAQRLLEIAREDRVYTCEACGRILVPDKKK
jgi:predicted  nucleic acid-binding Zn-ribbon protein